MHIIEIMSEVKDPDLEDIIAIIGSISRDEDAYCLFYLTEKNYRCGIFRLYVFIETMSNSVIIKNFPEFVVGSYEDRSIMKWICLHTDQLLDTADKKCLFT